MVEDPTTAELIADDRLLRRKRQTRWLLIFIPATLAALCAVSLILEQTASLRGRLVASFDVAVGRYELLGYGLPPPYRDDYVRLLRERYGIEYRQEALCLVSKRLVDYVDAYDSVSVAAAQRKFGHDIFTETIDEARAHWNDAHPEMQW